MRLRLMATYLGVPYQAGLGPDGTEATLFSPGPPPEELGFTPADGHWRKQVSLTDLGALWQSRPVGDYRGEPCLVLDDPGDRLHIAYLGRDAARAAQLGYWEIDREVFEVVVARNEVTGLTEERVDFPMAAATFGEYSEPAEKARIEAYPAPASGRAPGPAPGPAPGAAPGPAVNGGPAGNDQLAGYAGPDHASRMPDRMAAWHGSPEPWPGPPAAAEEESPARESAERESAERESAERESAERESPGRELLPGPWGEPWAEHEPEPAPETDPGPGRRTGRKDRISPESVFAELLSLAAIPQAAYAVDEEVPGAMCLVEADGGFEVFGRTEDARLEVHFFEDEEAAYFYLFGVLAAEAVRSGRLGPNGSARTNGHHKPENVSKYLRGRK